MTERRTDIPAFASVVKQKMKELFDHHVLIYEGCKSEARELEENIKALKQENDGLQKELLVLRERNELLHSENMRLKEDLVNTSTRLSLPCESCRSLMNQLEQQNKLLCTMMERKDQNLGQIIEKYLNKKSEAMALEANNIRENKGLCPKEVIDTLSQALSLSQDNNTNTMGEEGNIVRKERSSREDLSPRSMNRNNRILKENRPAGKREMDEGRCNRRSDGSDVSKEEDGVNRVTPESLRRTGKLTQAGKRRRARYIEEISPENKKKKLSSPTSDTCGEDVELNEHQINKGSEKKISSPMQGKGLAPKTCTTSFSTSPPCDVLSNTGKQLPGRKLEDRQNSNSKEVKLMDKLTLSKCGISVDDNARKTVLSDNRRNKRVSDNRRLMNNHGKMDEKEIAKFTIPETLAMDMPESDSDSENETNLETARLTNESPKLEEPDTCKVKLPHKSEGADSEKGSCNEISENKKSLGNRVLMKSLLISPPSLSSTPVSALYPHNHQHKQLNESITGTLPTFHDDIPVSDMYTNEEDSNDGNIIQASPCVVKKKSAKSFKQSFSKTSSNSHSPPNSPVFGGVENIELEKLKADHRKSVGSPTLFEESPHCTKKSHDFTEEDSSLLLAKPMSEPYVVDDDKDTSFSNQDTSLNRSRKYRSPLKFTPNMGGEPKVRLTRIKSGSQRSDESLTSPSVISGKLVDLASSGGKSSEGPALLRKTKSSGNSSSSSVASGRLAKGKGKNSPDKVSSQGRSRSRGNSVRGSRSPIGKLVIEKNTTGKKNQKKLFQTKLNSESFQGKKSDVGDKGSKVKEFNGKNKINGNISLTQQEEMLVEKAKLASLSEENLSNNACSFKSKGRNNECSPRSKGPTLFTSTQVAPKGGNGNCDDTTRLKLNTSPIAMDMEADTRDVDTLQFQEDCSGNINKDDYNSQLMFKKPFLPLTPKRRNSFKSGERNETLRRSPRLKEKLGDNRESEDSGKRSSARKLVMSGKSERVMEDLATKELSLKDLNGTLDPQFNMSEFDTLPEDHKTEVHVEMKRQALADKTLTKNMIQDNTIKSRNSDSSRSSTLGSAKRVTRSCVEAKGLTCGRFNGENHPTLGTMATIENLEDELQGCEEDYSEKSAVFGPVSLKPAKNQAVSSTKESHDHTSGNNLENETKTDLEEINCSFDRVPKQEEKLDYKYVDVVRKKAERDKLDAYVCIECDQYFNGMDISPAERDRRMRAVCRHKAKYAPPDTPEHYWSVGFPDTQECKDRGYLNVTQAKPSKFRRRKPLKKLSKAEAESKESSVAQTSDISD